jgi:hypothetical protein
MKWSGSTVSEAQMKNSNQRSDGDSNVLVFMISNERSTGLYSDNIAHSGTVHMGEKNISALYVCRSYQI